MSALSDKTNGNKIVINDSEPLTFWEYLKYEHLVAGTTAGVVSTLLLHPLDVIKIRFAVNDGIHSTPKYSSIVNAFGTIYKSEGFRGLYKGVTPNVFGAGSSWGFYFLFYNTFKNVIRKGDDDVVVVNSSPVVGPGAHLMAASQAGFVTLLITNPIWVTKTRLCLQFDNRGGGSSSTEYYNGMIDCLRKIYKVDGIRGFYRGLLPGIFGVSHGAVQFMFYEEMKKYYQHYKDEPIGNLKKLGTVEYLAFSASSKLIAVLVTYPYQVVRARFQNQHYSYDGTLDCIKKITKNEGWIGFYKGLGTNLVRVIPASMITFLLYENFAHMMLN